ncbi:MULTISPECIES: hypothetical protein [Bradyrhizobium]|jgi:ABC-2 type transport system permease protein|uniref:Uncharacterized protein n=2 Tax=Nitrobacteraceae TaxID=41294 RepID=A0ABS5G4J5_9BRAD|nr:MULTISPECIES: hypothetical protein [Bradyrhizobium]NPU22408.1 hypothetical protein [Bradyrhizobium sp. LMG 8443]RTL98929.1 MAG: hypothetical protein EKK32_17790 [Bradyrhizobiaceae bacterium]MBR1136234.1 hypothetical protein [Bradyrhizobium denitrificans]MCL8484926.1 hypothetical protein [Bradyrhizobium denitrificans]MDU1495740.1 hypothetical protein [Bradyrhizobium sp.]
MGVVVLATSMLSLIPVIRGLLDVPIEAAWLLLLAGSGRYLFATTRFGICLATQAGTLPHSDCC